MFLTKTTTNLFHKGLNFNKCCALNFVCNRLQLKFTSQARPKMYCNKQEHLNVTLRMSDSSTSETFTTASSVQLLQVWSFHCLWWISEGGLPIPQNSAGSPPCCLCSCRSVCTHDFHRSALPVQEISTDPKNFHNNQTKFIYKPE